MHFFRTSGAGGCSGWGCSTTARTATCEFSGLKLELDPEPECEPDLRGNRSRPLSAVRLASFSRSRSLTPTLPIPSPPFASGLRRPSGLSVLTLSRSENDDVRAILRPRGCSTCVWEGNDEADAERPRKGPGSDGARKAPTVWVGVFKRRTVVELGGALGDAMIVFGEGVRERDLLRDLERDLDRGVSGSGGLTMTSGPAGFCSIVTVEAPSARQGMRVVVVSIPRPRVSTLCSR